MKRILIAPLHWGLGHATRCIPIIYGLIANGFEPIIASDGLALALLKKEFPDLKHIELPSYNISYPKKGSRFKLKLLIDLPHIIKTIKKEKQLIKQLVSKKQIDGIISDNRFGTHHPSIPSVYITHQLKVLSGNTTWLSTRVHQKIISKFNQCWVPDFENNPNLSGELGHPKQQLPNVKYIGPLSRFKKLNIELLYDILVILSGPEPQRSLLEDKLLKELQHYNGKVILVRGIIEPEQTTETKNNITVVNYMTSNELEKSINASKLIISRSGYTTLMDLAKLEKKAFFIPTPGQFEQHYLAETLAKNQRIKRCQQDEFTLEHLQNIDEFSRLKNYDTNLNFKSLFGLFERE